MKDVFLSARWENIIMANYEVNPSVLLPYLPKGVELDLYKNRMYVSLVGFMFKQSKIFNIPVPFLGTFEEINLRFYVKRVEGGSIKRGVVFINESVPYKPVAWLANKLYKEHYIAIPTKNLIESSADECKISYEWKINNEWDHIKVRSGIEKTAMVPDSIEEFIFEHYYGYTKINKNLSQEYKVNHPRWFVHNIIDHSIQCNFKAMYGNDFSFLNNHLPASVIMAEGSPVTINWHRTKF